MLQHPPSQPFPCIPAPAFLAPRTAHLVLLVVNCSFFTSICFYPFLFGGKRLVEPLKAAQSKVFSFKLSQTKTQNQEFVFPSELFMESKNGLAWKDLKNNLVPSPCHGKGHLPQASSIRWFRNSLFCGSVLGHKLIPAQAKATSQHPLFDLTGTIPLCPHRTGTPQNNFSF